MFNIYRQCTTGIASLNLEQTNNVNALLKGIHINLTLSQQDII